MSEAVVLLGLIASIVSVIELSAKVVSLLHGLTSKTSEIPERFRSLSVELPLLAVTIECIRTQAEAGHFANDVMIALKAVVDSTLTQISALRTRLVAVLPSDDAPKVERVLRALKSLIKEDKVRQALEMIHKNIDVLVLHQTTRHVNLSSQMVEELSKLHVESTTSSESFGAMLKTLSQRSDETMRRNVGFRTDVLQVIKELQQEQRRLRVTILHSAPRDPPVNWPENRIGCPAEATHQSGSELEHIGKDLSHSKTCHFIESDRAFNEMALRDVTLRILSTLFSLIKFRW